MDSVARRDRAPELPHDPLELAPTDRVDVAYPQRGHAAPEITAEGARDDHALGGEDGADGDALGEVCVRHGGHTLDDVRAARETLELPDRLG